jgi:protein-tyrosine phosphatase
MNVNYTCTEIIPNLWIGDLNDAEINERAHDFERVINVLNIIEPVNGLVDINVLDALAVIIDASMKARCERILVHCGGGIERSPLVVAWYLATKKGMTFNNAYEMVEKKRLCVQRRDNWVSWEVRKERGML